MGQDRINCFLENSIFSLKKGNNDGDFSQNNPLSVQVGDESSARDGFSRSCPQHSVHSNESLNEHVAGKINAKVFVVILSWNSRDDLMDCLAHLKVTNYPNYVIVIVDNGSTDDSVAKVKEIYPDCIIIENAENVGFVGGCNIGMQYAMSNGADFVWLLNDDALVTAETLSKLVSFAESNPKVGMVSPVIFTHRESEKIQFCGAFVDFQSCCIVGTSDLKSIEQWQKDLKENLFLWGTALLIKRAVMNRIGLLDERFFAYFEDTDYCLRANAAGYIQRVVIDARIYHKNTTNQIERPPHYHYLYNRNMYLFFKKYDEEISQLKLVIVFVREILLLAARLRDCRMNECLESCLSGCWHAFKGVHGAPRLRPKMPRVLKALIIWHPYFFAKILNTISSRILK